VNYFDLPQWSLKHPAVVWVVTAALVAWGVVMFFTLPRSEDPQFRIRTASVVTPWPGQEARKIEQLVTEPLEQQIDGMDEVRDVRSISRMGLSFIAVDLEQSIDDVDAVWDKLRAKVNDARGGLPRGAGQPEVRTDYNELSAMWVVLYQKPAAGHDTIDPRYRYSPRQLEVFAQRLADEVSLLDEVADARLEGVREEAIYLETDPGAWSLMQLTTGQLTDMLRARNIVIPAGVMETRGKRFAIRASGELGSAREAQQIIVGSYESRAPVVLADLGITARRGYADPPRQVVRYADAEQSQACVLLTFTMKEGGRITHLGDKVRELMPTWRTTILPPDIEAKVVFDQPQRVEAALGEFGRNLVFAVLIVIIVALCLIGWRVAVVMAASVPVVMLGALGVAAMFGVTIEQVTIAALIVSLGMLVDCAIEVSDNVRRHLNLGKPRLQAALIGARQVALPVLMGTLTTVLAFLPMVWLPGEQGEFLYSLPVVVSTTLVVSWVLAFSLTVLLAAMLLRPGRATGLMGWLAARRQRSAAARHRVIDTPDADGQHTDDWPGYRALLRRCLDMKIATLGLAAALFVASICLVATGMIPTQFFPEAYRSQFLIDVHLPNGTPISETQRVVKEVEAVVREQAHPTSTGDDATWLSHMVSFVGTSAPRFNSATEPHQPAPNYANILVEVTDPGLVPRMVDRLRRAAPQRAPGARIVPHAIMTGPPVTSPIAVRVMGQDPEQLRAYGQLIEAALRETGKAWDIHDTWGNHGYQIMVDADENQAKAAGVTQASIAQTTNAFFSGHYLTTLRQGDHEVPIYLRLPPESRTLETLRQVYVEGERGKVPLDAVADVDRRLVPARIDRHSQLRNLEVWARPRAGVEPNAVLNEALPRIRAIGADMPPGYRIEIGGSQEKTIEAQANIARAFAVAIVLIALLMVWKYNGVALPLAILITVPMAMTGSLFGLYLFNLPLGFMANLGMLSLAGIVVNAAIVLIDFVRDAVRDKVERGDGVMAGPGGISGLTREAFYDALVQASSTRVTPILLTTLTTMGGLLPLALFGGALWMPMAIVLICGLLLATALTLLVIPATLALFAEYFGLSFMPRQELRELDAQRVQRAA